MIAGAPVGVRLVQRVVSWIQPPPKTFNAAMAAGNLQQAAQQLGLLLRGNTDVAATAGVLSGIGFQDPVATLAVSDGDPFLLSAALYLNQGSPSMELLGTLAWCHQRGRLEKGVELVKDFGVPWLHVRRVTDNLYIDVKEQRPWRHRQNIYWLLRGIQKVGIPPHQWKDIFVNRVDGDMSEHIRVNASKLLRALNAAKRLGFQGSLLWEAAQLILNSQKAKDDLAAIKREHTHPSQTALRRDLTIYWIMKNFGGATGEEGLKIVEALEGIQSPVDQWWRYAHDVRNHGMEALKLSWKYRCSVPLAARAKGREEILERLSQTTLPSQEWELVLRIISHGGIQIEEYLTALENWERSGYTWEEHFVFGFLLEQGSDFMQSYPPDVLHLSIELKGSEIGWLEKFTSTEEGVTPKKAFDLAKEKYDEIFNMGHWERLPDLVAKEEGAKVFLQIDNQDQTPSHTKIKLSIKISEKGISPIGKASTKMDATVFQHDDTLFIANIQNDSFRRLPKDQQERWKDWERIFIQFLENWAKENGFKRLLISTVFGSTSAHGTLANASMRNLVNVYLYPRKLGYELTPVEEEWLGTLHRFTRVPRYFWTKTIG